MRHTWLVIDISVTLLLLVLSGLIAIVVTSSQHPIIWGARSYTVLSGSMAPTYPIGSIVMTAPRATYAVGDVIAYTHDSSVVTHRITAIEKIGTTALYTVKGDANAHEDPVAIPSQNVLGTVVAGIPYLGIVVGYIKTPFGFFTMIFLPGLLFVVLELLEIQVEYQRHVERRILHRLGLV